MILNLVALLRQSNGNDAENYGTSSKAAVTNNLNTHYQLTSSRKMQNGRMRNTEQGRLELTNHYRYAHSME